MADLPTITAAELARRVHGTLEGDGQRPVRTVAPLDEAGPDALSWVGDPKYLPRLANSQAGVVLLPTDCKVPTGHTVIRVADPDLAVCTALACLAPPLPTIPIGIHSTACVSETAIVEGAGIGAGVYVGRHAVVGPGTELHPGVHVGDHCTIGRDCRLWPNVVVRERAVLGDRVIVHPNTTIGADGFGYQQRGGKHLRVPQIGRVVIEDDVEIGANTCIDRARSGETHIGRGTKIDNLVQIGHNVRIGEDCLIIAQCGISGSVTLGNHVVLAGQVGVTDHVRIGDRAVVAAKSGVPHDMPDGKVYRGIPGRDKAAFNRQEACVRRLPAMVEQLRALIKRVERIEAATNDPTRS